MKLLIVQAVKFLLIGLINSASGLAVIFGLIYWLNIDPVLANVAGYSVGLTISFLLNRSWTFNAGRTDTSQILKYAIAFLVSFFLNIALLKIFSSNMGFGIYFSQFIAVGTYSISMFLLCRFFVFPNRRQRSK